MSRFLRVSVLSAWLGALLVGCEPAQEPKAAAPAGAAPTKEAAMKPATSGYAEVNNVKL